MPIAALRIDHTGITVSDLDRSIALWRGSLFAYVHDPDGVTVELIQLAVPEPG